MERRCDGGVFLATTEAMTARAERVATFSAGSLWTGALQLIFKILWCRWNSRVAVVNLIAPADRWYPFSDIQKAIPLNAGKSSSWEHAGAIRWAVLVVAAGSEFQGCYSGFTHPEHVRTINYLCKLNLQKMS